MLSDLNLPPGTTYEDIVGNIGGGNCMSEWEPAANQLQERKHAGYDKYRKECLALGFDPWKDVKKPKMWWDL